MNINKSLRKLQKQLNSRFIHVDQVLNSPELMDCVRAMPNTPPARRGICIYQLMSYVYTTYSWGQ